LTLLNCLDQEVLPKIFKIRFWQKIEDYIGNQYPVWDWSLRAVLVQEEIFSWPALLHGENPFQHAYRDPGHPMPLFCVYIYNK